MNRKHWNTALEVIGAAAGLIVLYEFFKKPSAPTATATATATPASSSQGTSGFAGVGQAPGKPWTSVMVPGVTYFCTIYGPAYAWTNHTGNQAQADLLSWFALNNMQFTTLNGPDSHGNLHGTFWVGIPTVPPTFVPNAVWIAIWSSQQNVTIPSPPPAPPPAPPPFRLNRPAPIAVNRYGYPTQQRL